MLMIIEKKIKQLEQEVEAGRAEIAMLEQLLSESECDLITLKVQLNLVMADRTYVVEGHE
jgi:hypothetical protein